jgi:hypothetical protein
MIKFFFLVIILFILIQQYLENPNKSDSEIIVNTHEPNTVVNSSPTIPRVQEFYKPHPWSRIVTDDSNEYPFFFHIKIRIPSLNDYEDWKQVIPNIDFNARTGEIIIPAKDEASALAIANLMISNFSGNLSLQEILDKKLIQISINKAKNHEMVKTKLREQIMESLYPSNKPQAIKEVQEYKEDTSVKKPTKNQSISSEDFVDTFQHFTYEKVDEGINAYESSGYSAF